MNRSYHRQSFCKHSGLKELRLKTAIHEAGHAAAIYLGNKQRQLPPVFFQIVIAGLSDHIQASGFPGNCFAKVQGGRLIHTLPDSVDEATRDFSQTQKQAYLQAFEADMVNFLIGPLAEANYIALMDDEIINCRLVNLTALHNYGGTADLQVIEEYLDCLSRDITDREQKISELFAAAFNFINDRANWRAIIALANAILVNKNEVIDCGEIIAVLDSHFYTARKIA